jgi:hypothetical protein
MTYEIIPLVKQAHDLSRNTYGRLTAIAPVGKTQKIRWLCICECGSETVVDTNNLEHGKTKSCGCLQREYVVAKLTTHGMSGSKEHMIYRGMKSRCENQNSSDYPNYGGRGIGICDRWQKLENFYADMGKCPKGMTLDRIDNDGDYKPGNCKWATRRQQANNKRNNRFIEYNGKRLTLAQWSRRAGISPAVIRSRIYRGWPIERALTEKIRGT